MNSAITILPNYEQWYEMGTQFRSSEQTFHVQ